MNSISHLRIIDASLNRASEGLRVVEDYLRFVADDPLLTRTTKTLRHELAEIAREVSAEDLHAARDSRHDVGSTIATSSEATRADAWGVCAASFKRAEQSLRSLEEYGKLISLDFARRIEAIRYRLYTLEKGAEIGRASQARLYQATLYVLVDGRESSDRFERLVEGLVDVGVAMIQLRDKRLEDRVLTERARSLLRLTRDSTTLAIVNDRADIAAVVGADGVHLGQDDLSVKDARAIVGPRMLVGVSTHNIDQARAAVLDGANYLGAGPTFPSQTKSFDVFAGLEYLRQVADEISLPTFAIGGITAENLNEVKAVGISRVAVGGAITAVEDPLVGAKQLLSMLDR